MPKNAQNSTIYLVKEMRFCNYLKILHSYIGTEKTQADFVIFITTLFMREPKTKQEEIEDDADLYNPLNQLKQRTLIKIYTGEEGHKISRKNARVLKSRFSNSAFEVKLKVLDYETQKRFISELKDYGYNARSNNIEKIASDIYFELLSALTQGRDFITKEQETEKNILYDNDPKNKKKVSVEIKTFMINHESELPMLELCQIAENIKPLHKFSRQLYNDYQLLSEENKKEISRLTNTIVYQFKSNWLPDCIRRFEEDVSYYKLGRINVFYDGAKYLHQALCFSAEKIENIDPYIYTLPIESQQVRKLLQRD